MNSSSRSWSTAFVLLAALLLAGTPSACNLTEPAADSPPVSVVEQIPDEPLVILDYSAYTAIDDETFYKNKYLGQIFVIKQWITSSPEVNTHTMFGKIPFTLHPDQDIEAMEFTDPYTPIVLTGYGKGWGKYVFRGSGTGGTSVCTGEVNLEFRLVGGFYPAPTCTLDVDIVSTYFNEKSIAHCVYSSGLELDLPGDFWVDMETDVKLPIEFQIPGKYMVRYEDTLSTVKYDHYYYLFKFWGKPPSQNELDTFTGDVPLQFYNTGCQNVSLYEGIIAVPEGLEGEEYPPDVWDVMLTPESLRVTPQP